MRNNRELFRLDKNIAQNIDLIIDLDGVSSEDKALIRNIIYHLCYTRQTDLFGYGNFDPRKFASEMKYSEGYLRKRHPNPYQLSGLTEQEIKELYQEEKLNPADKVFDSYLENALFILNSKALRFSRTAKQVCFENNTVKYINVSESYILLPALKTVTTVGRGSPKVSYTYAINQIFLSNLSLYFMRFDKNSVISLRRSGLDNLYLYLKNFKDTLIEKVKRKEPLDLSQNFDFLCGLAGVPLVQKDGTEFKNPRTIKQKLIKALVSVNTDTDLKFTLTWAKKTEKCNWDYRPLFQFEEVEKVKAGAGISLYTNMVQKNERNEIFKENLKFDLLDVFKKHNENWGDDIESSLFDWLVSRRNMAEKEFAFRQAQYHSFGKIHKQIDKITEKWLKELASHKSFSNMLRDVNIDMDKFF